jgi:hypothetical protein
MILLSLACAAGQAQKPPSVAISTPDSPYYGVNWLNVAAIAAKCRLLIFQKSKHLLSLF